MADGQGSASKRIFTQSPATSCVAPTDPIAPALVPSRLVAFQGRMLIGLLAGGLIMAMIAAVLCVSSMSAVGGHLRTIGQAARTERQAVAIIDQIGASLVAFTATTIDDLTIEERQEVLVKTEAAWKELQQLLASFNGTLDTLTAEHRAIFDKSLSSMTHSWQELRDQPSGAIQPAEKAFHFLRILEDLDAVRIRLTSIRTSAAETAATDTNIAFGELRTTVGLIAAIILICVLLAGAGAVLVRHYIDGMWRANTVLLQTNKALEDSKRNAEEASQMKSEFLMTFSHELRTPLNAIIGFSQLLRTRPLKAMIDSEDREYFDEINASGLHLLSLINDILDFSKAGAGKLQLTESAFRSGLIIGQVASMSRARCVENRLTMHLDLADAPVIMGDERRVKQILLNLLSNAIKFTPAGGIITIGARVDDDTPVLFVRDSGIGIAADDIPRVMERFGQVDSSMSRRYEGTGLGLPLVVAMAELHGGRLHLDSTLGEGTIASVILPPGRLVGLDGSVALAA